MFLFYLVIGALQMFFDDDDDDECLYNVHLDQLRAQRSVMSME